MSLLRYALTIAGPRDAAIALTLNILIPGYFLKSASPLPLLGPDSVAMFLGPMFLLLFSLATFFGIMNGVMQRKNGAAGPALARDARWFRWAFRTGAANGILACAAFLAAIYLLDKCVPGLTVSPGALLGMQASLAAVLGYCVQVFGVLMSGRI